MHKPISKPVSKSKPQKPSPKMRSIAKKATELKKSLGMKGKKTKPGAMISKMNKMKVEAMM